MGKYDGMAATALALISKKGTDIPVTRRTKGAFDPVTQAETVSSAVHPFKGVGLPPGRQAEFRVGSLVGKRAIELHFAQKGQSINPEPGDKVTFQGFDWTIFWSQTYDPAGDGAIYTLAYGER